MLKKIVLDRLKAWVGKRVKWVGFVVGFVVGCILVAAAISYSVQHVAR